MPGEPLSIYDSSFQPIILFISGDGNIGKSTLMSSLQNNHIFTFSIDMWCYEFFQPESLSPDFNLGKRIQKTVRDSISSKELRDLTKYIIDKIQLIDYSSHKVYIFEGHILHLNFVLNTILNLDNFKRCWKIEKIKQ